MASVNPRHIVALLLMLSVAMGVIELLRSRVKPE